jgi:hypothetical protein
LVRRVPEFARYLPLALVIGAGATAVMDIWTAARRRFLGIPSLDYALVGRWIAHGRFRHDPITASPPITGERPTGWIVHYLTGALFAGLLLATWGLGWARHPTPAPALIVGIGSVAAPFLIMHPGMGAGFAASRTPRPFASRLQSLVAHIIFGLGLYAAGLVTSMTNL